MRNEFHRRLLFNRSGRRRALAAGAVLFLLAGVAWDQVPVLAQSPAKTESEKPAPAKPPAETHITPEQAKELFASMDELLKFASEETGLPLKHPVKRTLTTRAAVEKYLSQKFDEDEDSKRMQRGEIVLKKFGLLDRDFDLKPFMLILLKEQIAGYYDSKTKTVYMLDWIDPETQKPVLVHELTHALQDQHTDLEKWSDQTPADPSHTASEDNDHLSRDEMDTARTAATEGQAMAVFVDYSLKPSGRSLIDNPELLEQMQDQMQGTEDSPVLARAPLLLSESLLFPYKDGLSFEQDVWMDKGRKAAFAGVLDRPPSSSWEVINPRVYEQGKQASIPVMPDIHPLLDKRYKAYDIGQVGQLDLRILAQIFGGEAAARELTPAWDGGIYWAGQTLSAKTPAEQASTSSIALFYLSSWKNAASAHVFARMYADQLGRKYSGVKLADAEKSPSTTQGDEVVYNTNEGPVVITVQDKMVFVSESFDLETAHKLADLLINGQGTGEIHTAGVLPAGQPAASSLTGDWIHFLASCGMMKAALIRRP
jgi:hypothetical protein